MKDVVIGNKPRTERAVDGQINAMEQRGFDACLEKAERESNDRRAARTKKMSGDQPLDRGRSRRKIAASEDAEQSELEELLLVELVGQPQIVTELISPVVHQVSSPALEFTGSLPSVGLAVALPHRFEQIALQLNQEMSSSGEYAPHMATVLASEVEKPGLQMDMMHSVPLGKADQSGRMLKWREITTDALDTNTPVTVDERPRGVGTHSQIMPFMRLAHSDDAGSIEPLGQEMGERAAIVPTVLNSNIAPPSTIGRSPLSSQMPIRFGSIHPAPRLREIGLTDQVETLSVDAAQVLTTLDAVNVGGLGTGTDELTIFGPPSDHEDDALAGMRKVRAGVQLIGMGDTPNFTPTPSLVQQTDGSSSMGSSLAKQLETYLMQATSIHLANGEATEMQITLEPQELGKLGMRISMENGMVAARFDAESHVVKQLIEAELPRLKDHLQQQGIRLDQVTVQVGGGQTQGFGERQAHHRQPSWSPRQRRNLSGGLAVAHSPSVAITTGLRPGHAVDYTV